MLYPMFTKGTSVMIKTTRTIGTSSILHANNNHYDVLGITPKANQRDIKSAYYKLSKVYHPDKSNDVESANKFREVSEAYEVLGNIKLKKMYDKGLYVGRENAGQMQYKPDPEPTDPTLKFYKSRVNKNYAATIDGTTPIYNFDAWSRNHYADIFQKTQYEKKFQEKKKMKQLDTKISDSQEIMFYSLIALSGVFIFFVFYGKDDYDIVKKEQQTQKKNS